MVLPAEKCFDKTRYEYLEVGDRWARVHQGQVEQCACVGGHVQCEDTRHTGTLWLGGGGRSRAFHRVSPAPYSPRVTLMPHA